MNRRLLLSSLVAVVALIPQVASANAGTPLMWAGMLHLTLGNALIGIGEGLLIARVFQLPKRRCIGWMIAANYLSAWVGGIGLNMIASQMDWNLYNAWDSSGCLSRQPTSSRFYSNGRWLRYVFGGRKRNCRAASKLPC
jgi:hypothetical protein